MTMVHPTTIKFYTDRHQEAEQKIKGRLLEVPGENPLRVNFGSIIRNHPRYTTIQVIDSIERALSDLDITNIDFSSTTRSNLVVEVEYDTMTIQV